MATLIITKISGVLFLKVGTQNPKSYFGATGKFQLSDNGNTILITILGGGQSVPDQYTVAYGDLTVGTSVATSGENATVLLNAIFGS